MQEDMSFLGYVSLSGRESGTRGAAIMDQLNEALISIRQILRATELHGKALRVATGLKTSQLLVLQALEDSEELTVGEITGMVHMAQASVTMIVARLEELGLVARTRGTADKRKVYVRLTQPGHDILEQAPEALHQRFAEQFEPLASWEKTMLVSSLQRVASMLDASDIDAAPILQLGPTGHTDPTDA